MITLRAAASTDSQVAPTCAVLKAAVCAAFSRFHTWIWRSLGLPKPEVLHRYRADQPEFSGLVAIGAGREPHLLDALANLVASIGVTSVAHESAGLWVPLANRHGLMTGRFEPTESGSSGKLAALLFDASGIEVKCDGREAALRCQQAEIPGIGTQVPDGRRTRSFEKLGDQPRLVLKLVRSVRVVVVVVRPALGPGLPVQPANGRLEAIDKAQ